MNNNDNSLSVDPRKIPLVRSLKDHPKASMKLSNKIMEDLSSEKTSDISPVVENEENINNNNRNQETFDSFTNNKNNKNPLKKTKSLNKIRTSKSKNNTMIKKSTKISIDAEADQKTKSGTSEKRNGYPVQNNKIRIVSRSKDPPINKNRSKYIQNLLNDMSKRKYKQSCVDLLKHDNAIKKLYEQCGFEKNNYNYENLIQNKFFNNPLFMFKLEILFLDESNYGKKNFKEAFFRKEIINHLNMCIDEPIYKEKVKNLTEAFKEGFEQISKFDPLHD